MLRMVEDHVRMGAAMVMTFVVVTFGKGRRGGKHQEEERSGEKLLHATNLARNPGPGEGTKVTSPRRGIRKGTGSRHIPGERKLKDTMTKSGCFPCSQPQALLF